MPCLALLTLPRALPHQTALPSSAPPQMLSYNRVMATQKSVDADETDAFVDNLRTQRVDDKHLGSMSSEQVRSIHP